MHAAAHMLPRRREQTRLAPANELGEAFRGLRSAEDDDRSAALGGARRRSAALGGAHLESMQVLARVCRAGRLDLGIGGQRGHACEPCERLEAVDEAHRARAQLRLCRASPLRGREVAERWQRGGVRSQWQLGWGAVRMGAPTALTARSIDHLKRSRASWRESCPISSSPVCSSSAIHSPRLMRRSPRRSSGGSSGLAAVATLPARLSRGDGKSRDRPSLSHPSRRAAVYTVKRACSESWWRRSARSVPLRNDGNGRSAAVPPRSRLLGSQRRQAALKGEAGTMGESVR